MKLAAPFRKQRLARKWQFLRRENELVLLLRACPRCHGALTPDWDPEVPGGWACLNCGCVLQPDLQLPHTERKALPQAREKRNAKTTPYR
jgi:hypothetical protein